MLEGDGGREERRRQICFRKRKPRAFLKLKVKKLGGVGLLKKGQREAVEESQEARGEVRIGNSCCT